MSWEPIGDAAKRVLAKTLKRRVTLAEIEAARTGNGGWTKEQLAAWGVPWPPPKGWKKALEKEAAE